MKKCWLKVQNLPSHEGDKSFLFVAIPAFDIGLLTALLAIFVCFHVSEKGDSSGSDKNHFNTNWPLYNVQFCKTIIVSSYGLLISEECYNLNWMVVQTAI